MEVASQNPEKEWLERLAQYLLNTKKSKINIHDGVCDGKRVRYFRGKRAITAILDENFKKELPNAPAISNRLEAKKVMEQLLANGFLLSAEKLKPKVLHGVLTKDFSDERFYIWLYEDPAEQKWAIIKGVLLVLAVLLIVMFPMWPYQLRLGAWYLSVGALSLFGVLIAILIVRIPVFYISRLIVPPGIWIFPNINEDVSFLDSFKPVWDYEQPSKEKKARRRRGRDDHSGSSHQEDNEDEDNDGGSTPRQDSASASAAGAGHQSAGGPGEHAGGELRKRAKGREAETRVDSENDGDNEGAENEPDADLDTDLSPQPVKNKAKSQ